MSILQHVPLRRLNQNEFGAIAYRLMQHVFAIHEDFGRLFDEQIYKQELALRLPDVRLETPVDVIFDTFCKRYYFDVVVGDGALFEFKARETVVARNRAQTLHYLLLADAAHAKLINLRPESVEHEFVNTTLTLTQRRSYTCDDTLWDSTVPGAAEFRRVLCNCLNDWGTGLELVLYQEALNHFLNGPVRDPSHVPVLSNGLRLGFQPMDLAAPRVAFRFTAFTNDAKSFAHHARRLLSHADLDAILWANITATHLKLITLRK